MVEETNGMKGYAQSWPAVLSQGHRRQEKLDTIHQLMLPTLRVFSDELCVPRVGTG